MKPKTNHNNRKSLFRYKERRILTGYAAIFLFFPFAGIAQTILNATGGTALISGNVYSYSIGEMVIIGTSNISSTYFTQGLLQNDDVNLRVYDNQYLSEGLGIYPNPVADIVFLQASFQNGGKLSLQLYDLRGRLIMRQGFEMNSGTIKKQMDLSVLQEGTYLLQAVLKEGKEEYRHTFKILKISVQ